MVRNLRRKIAVATAAYAVSFAMIASPASAKDDAVAPPDSISAGQSFQSSKDVPNAARRYFVEFRSRSALSYGHTFLVHGKLNAAGQVGQVKASQVAGLHPATESSIPWMIGHVLPVISETGASDGDTEDEYVTARYRVLLTEAQYANVSAYIAKHQKNSPLWHAVLYNCNAWVADVAKYMNLKSPTSTMLYPEEFINGMAQLNGSQPVQQAGSKPKPKPALKRSSQETAVSPRNSPKPNP